MLDDLLMHGMGAVRAVVTVASMSPVMGVRGVPARMTHV